MKMNEQDQLTVLAYVDGELSGRELIAAEELIAANSEAAALAEELRLTRAVLRTSEPEATLPVAHSFYWATIAKRIETAAPEREPLFGRIFRPAFLLRYVTPAVGVAALGLMAVLNMDRGVVAEGEEMVTSPEASAVVFHSEPERLTVVWLQSDDNSDLAETERVGNP